MFLLRRSLAGVGRAMAAVLLLTSAATAAIAALCRRGIEELRA